MIAELRITPIESKRELLDAVASVVRVLAECPIAYRVNPMGTTLEGDLESILEAVRRCHAEVRKDSTRTLIELSIDDRPAPPGEIKRSLEHLEAASPGHPLERLIPLR